MARCGVHPTWRIRADDLVAQALVSGGGVWGHPRQGTECGLNCLDMAGGTLINRGACSICNGDPPQASGAEYPEAFRCTPR